MEPPASRNAPCPCGSGRRWKNCHGAPGFDIGSTPPGIKPDDAADAGIRPQLSRALDAQRAGRYDNAIAGYDAALAKAPDHFDALHMRGVAHFQRGTFDAALADLDRAGALRPGDAALRFNRQLVVNAIARRPAETEIARLARAFRARMDSETKVAPPAADPVRVIAFFLPQFHRIAENDRWWGDGFTEWTNVRRARPNFVGHPQPHAPGELGWYDLTDPEVRARQAALAREHGIDAFCYYHYWFGGKRLLEAPLDAVLASGEPDFPFCLCWANENWTRRWDGLDHEILIEQRYGADDARTFIRDLVPYLTDRRYLRVNGRPLLVIYKPSAIPDLALTVAVWREAARAAGLGEIYLVAVARNGQDDPTPHGFDAAIEFPPIGHTAELTNARLAITNPDFQGAVFGYRNLMADYLLRPRPPFRQFRGVTPMWDNTARRQNDGMILAGSSPEDFGVWLEHALRQTRLRHAGDERLLFVNAWNEWAEGNHLEPDAAHGRAYLEAVRTARRVEQELPRVRPHWADVERDTSAAQASGALHVRRFTGNLDTSLRSVDDHSGARFGRADAGVSVVMPVYNHARFLPRALASLAAQSVLPSELVAVDDGSSDESARIIAAFAADAPFPVTLVVQANAGADVALNRGMALARGPLIALINSDDAYAPTRLEMLVAAIDDQHVLAFSGIAPVDADDNVVDTSYARELVARVDEVSQLPHLLYALVRHNPAVSTGNLVFRRSLLSATGGFASFRICHDWDFLLAAALATEPAFVPAPLYFYRLHDTNTFATSTLAGRTEGDEVLGSFFAAMDRHPLLADSGQRASFVAFARGAGLGGYLKARER